MTNLISLADRVERLAGPCRETDAEIALATGWITFELKGFGRRWQRGHGTVVHSPPHFTGSFEDVLAIVPEGMSYSLYDIVGKRESVRMWNGFGVDALTQGQTPALALLSACLRSLARMKEEEL